MPGPYPSSATISDIVTDLTAHIRNKTILTTGVSPGGLGAHFVTAVAAAGPACLILAGRNPTKIEATASAITAAHPKVRTKVLQLDLASQKAVRAAAATVLAWDDVPVIDVLVNNAGIMGTEYARSEDGLEMQFAANHVGPFLFTNLVLPKMMAASEPRVVMVSSHGHRLSPVRFNDYNFEDGKTYNKWRAYGQSKTANILTAVSLAEKLGKKGLVAVSLHPGVIGTNLSTHLDWSVESKAIEAVVKEDGNTQEWEPFRYVEPPRGVATHAYAAFDPTLKDHNGAYLLDTRLADPSRDSIKQHATSADEAERLWKLSEKLLGQEFRW